MTTPAVFIRSVILLLLSLSEIRVNTFQMSSKRFKQIDLNKFRIPRAAAFRNYMNESVDPCADFYEFACGNWQNYYPASEDNPITSPMLNLKDTVNKELHVLLEENIRKNEGQIERKVKDFFASCMDIKTVSEQAKQVFLNLVKNNSGMPAVQSYWDSRSYNWTAVVANMRKQYGTDILIGVNIKPDIKNRQGNRIYIGEPSTLIPKGICREADTKNSRYEELQTEIANNMAYWFGMEADQGSKFATELLEFELNLCRGMSDDLGPDVFPNITRMTLRDLNTLYPSMRFYDFVTTSLGHSIYQTLYLQHHDYFSHLSTIITSTPKSVIANYIMYRALNVISFPEENNREKRAVLCVEKCMQHFPKAVGEMFNKVRYNVETKEEIEQLWRKLTETFKTNIASQLWIEESTRKQAAYKIDRMEIVFPKNLQDSLFNEYGTVEIHRENFWQNVLNLLKMEQTNEINIIYNNNMVMTKQVEAFNTNVGHVPMQNIIRVPVGLLQQPIYHWTAPFSYKYGIMGYLIGREVIHGFDEYGWNFDDISAMRLWWDQNSTLLYKEKVTCFRDQYLAYAGKNLELSSSEIDEKIRQIVADNGALNISFNSYLKWLEETDDLHVLYDETLPDVDYTNTQLFFISFAQNFCTAKYLEEEPIGFFPWDVANYLDKFNVNGVLWNMGEFSREFNCLPGTEMNPGDKCGIY